jgi:phosphatidate cytidylyltransferase
MNQPARKWDDLKTRLMTAAALVLVVAYAIWAGGGWFVALSALVAAAMIWELARIVSPTQRAVAIVLGVLATLWAWVFLQGSAVIGIIGALLVAPTIGAFVLRDGKAFMLTYGLAVVLGCFSFAILRLNVGFWPLVWLVAVVVATDVAGYFAGRYLGGPRLWPRISPKKTWSGTVAGWLAAAVVGAIFVTVYDFERQFIALSVLVAVAAQCGDITESAIKRRFHVKDSSGLLPGHGGALDRFDGLVGAGVLVLVVLLPLGAFTAVTN